MCTNCGCGLTNESTQAAVREQDTGSGSSDLTVTTVNVMRHLLEANERRAAHNREHLERHDVVAINLMSSPGAGKTALLEATIDALGADLRIGVIVGDLETENDATRLRAHGVPAVQITTGQACHLDAAMVHEALHELSLDALDVLFIENVGNLVCPASFDLGQHRNVVLLSVTEGDDKPSKYPVMFRSADAVALSKEDLLPHVGEFDPAAAIAALHALGNPVPVMTLSARSGAGIDAWFAWLRETVAINRTAMRHRQQSAAEHAAQ